MAAAELPESFDPPPHERLVWKQRANRTQHFRRAVGGSLYLTNLRLGFRPHWFDAELSGEQWWAPLSMIAHVGKEKKSLRAIQGGSMRDRLKITVDNGNEDYFVVNKLDKIIENLRAATSTS